MVVFGRARRAHHAARVMLVAVAALLVATACQRVQAAPPSPDAGAPLPPASLTATAPAHIVRVVDGDTVVVGDPQRGVLTVRMLGIDSPETVRPHTPVQPCGPEASHRTHELAPAGTEVWLQADPTQDVTDRYGRTLAYVWTRTSMLGYNLVAEGLARTYVYHHRPGIHAAALDRAQTDAQHAHRGLWGGPCAR